MSHRSLIISAILAAGAGVAGLAQADIVAVDSGIAVRESDGIAPGRGMTMTEVASKFGAPVSKVPAVGKPPISRWEYPGFVVYFERDHVIHSVISEAPPASPNAPQAPPAEAPATSQSRTMTSDAPPPPALDPPPAPEPGRAAEPAPAADDANVAPAAAAPVETPPAP